MLASVDSCYIFLAADALSSCPLLLTATCQYAISFYVEAIFTMPSLYLFTNYLVRLVLLFSVSFLSSTLMCICDFWQFCSIKVASRFKNSCMDFYSARPRLYCFLTCVLICFLLSPENERSWDALVQSKNELAFITVVSLEG